MRKTVITILIVLMAANVSAQQTNGTYSFLRTTNSARVAALGGLPLPVYDNDIQLSTFNPATIGEGMSNKMGLSYVDYYTDINFATLQYAHTFNSIGSYAATVQYHNYGHFEESSESGVVTGDFSCSDFSVNLGWGRQLTPNWNIGAAVKYAGIQYENYSAGALAVDVAGMYKSNNGWIFSLTARNIGTQLFNNINNDNGSQRTGRRHGPTRPCEQVREHFQHVWLTLVVIVVSPNSNQHTPFFPFFRPPSRRFRERRNAVTEGL